MKSNNNKSLGILFFFVFIIISLWPLFNEENVRIWSVVIAIIFLTLALIKPHILNPLTKLWINFGELIGKFISPIVIGLIYFVILTPIGLLMRIFNKDLLNLKFSKKNSYWIKRETKLNSMDKQY
mgnify:CR=1 FL=1|tara:strand:+ start:1753 stop:2127 length:375 start_codon:yes stop_codon:yes gene_type:complete